MAKKGGNDGVYRVIDAIGTRVADEAWLPYASR